jgi:structural maintenance of chromosome 2
MYVKEIIIEGFKSYAQSTTVNLFDPHFNAITGLNGSGKSNILDAICFVLGITNLTQVRATNLQELIYKGGNAGITKATVSITFNNLDKNQSPPGYQDYEEITVTRQITVAGKHKYLINGQNATAQRVADLFCSTQLNVNNPNFLIMQGKITKVLNMKPIEILSMIEEAAGTKTYDIKKSNALATIDKKNAKLNEIERVLREDITPMIEKLKQERSSYIEYQKCEREYVHLHKISLAFNYYQSAEILKSNQSNLNKIESELEKNNNRIFEINQTIISLKNFVEEAKLEMKNSQDHNMLIKLEADLKQVQIEITKINSEIQFVNSNIKSEHKKHSECEKNINENKSMIETKNIKLEEMKAKSNNELNALETAESNLKKAQRSYEALCCGFVVDGENDALESAQDQLLKVDNQISEKKTQIKMSEMK